MKTKGLDVRATAQRIGVTSAYVYQLLRDGRLPASKDLAGRWLIDCDAVEARARVRELKRAIERKSPAAVVAL